MGARAIKWLERYGGWRDIGAGASEGLKQHWGQRNGGAEAQKWLEERYTVTDLEDVAGHL